MAVSPSHPLQGCHCRHVLRLSENSPYRNSVCRNWKAQSWPLRTLADASLARETACWAVNPNHHSRTKVTFRTTRYSLTLPFLTSTRWSLIQAPFTFLSVFDARFTPLRTASSKLSCDEEIISLREQLTFRSFSNCRIVGLAGQG